MKRAVNTGTGKAAAIKILDRDKTQADRYTQIKKDISIMTTIHHQNVVSFKDKFATSTKFLLFLNCGRWRSF
jgi:serine/threonine protein kinase